MLRTILTRMKVPGWNNLHLITQTDIRHLTSPHPRRPKAPLRTRQAHWRTICQPMRTGGSIHAPWRDQARSAERLPRIAHFGNDGGVLVEYSAVVGIHAGELAGDIFVVRGDDGVLGDVFDLVDLGVGVRDVGVLVVVVEPVGGAWGALEWKGKIGVLIYELDYGLSA